MATSTMLAGPDRAGEARAIAHALLQADLRPLARPGHWLVLVPIADAGPGPLRLVVRVVHGSIHVVSREA